MTVLPAMVKVDVLEMVEDEIELVIRELTPGEIWPDNVLNAVDLLRKLQGQIFGILEGAGFDKASDENRRATQAALFGMVKAFMAENDCRSSDVQIVQEMTVNADTKTVRNVWACKRRGEG